MDGVYPVYENQFGIGKDELTIADMESFSVSMDNGVEEWNPMDQGGWMRRLMTAKSISISLSGKRNLGDPGNDLVFSKMMTNGRASEEDFVWNFPSGAKLKFPQAVINVTTPGGGDSTNVDTLEFDVMSNGKPTFTDAPPPTPPTE